MLSNQKAKYIKSLQIKKYRAKQNKFLVEGAKNVHELLQSVYEIDLILSSEQFAEQNDRLISGSKAELIIDKPEKISSVGTLKTNDAALAIVKMPKYKPLVIDHDLTIALDDVRDPGNLGTIIRTADWYGIKQIIASKETADVFNPKVIQASMGSFLRVQVHYWDLENFFTEFSSIPVTGAVLDGQPVSAMKVYDPMILLLGNESRGIHLGLHKYINHRVTIPRFGRAESLNVAISTAVLCDNIRRIGS